MHRQRANSVDCDVGDISDAGSKLSLIQRWQRGRGWLVCCQATGGLVLFFLFACWYLQLNPVHFWALGSESDSKSASGVRSDKMPKEHTAAGLAIGLARESLASQLPSFHVDSTSATLGGMSCELLLLDASEVEFNVQEVLQGEKVKITSFGSVNLTIRIASRELKSHFIPLFEKQGLSDVHIEFGTGTVKVTAKRKLKLIGKVKLSAKGQFYVFGGDGIGLRLTEIEWSQFNIGVSKLGYSVEEVLPPLDLGGMFAAIVIDDLNITSNYLQVVAHAEKLPGDKKPMDAISVF
jgi:hypothetical protein